VFSLYSGEAFVESPQNGQCMIAEFGACIRSTVVLSCRGDFVGFGTPPGEPELVRARCLHLAGVEQVLD
jgi:hypothetical protein